MIKNEIEGDIVYSSRELKKEFRDAPKNHFLKALLRNYWCTLRQIVKRFVTKNNTGEEKKIVKQRKKNL